MRVLIADRFPESHVAQLRDRGFQVSVEPGLGAADLADAVAGVDVLVVRSTRVEAGVFTSGDLELVIRAGAGVNTIDVDAAASRGVYVANVPGRNAIAVAELVFGLLLAIDRNIPDNVADLRAGRWDKARYQQARGLFGRSVGVVGVGSIGLEFARRARAFGMEVHAVAKENRDDATRWALGDLGVQYHMSLEEMAAAVDVLTFHVPASPSTQGMVGAELLRHVRPGAVIINTSRGDLVDEEALLAAIEEKDLRAGLDVYQDEPVGGTGEFDSRLARHPNVYGTHHIGASTEQAQEAVADEVVRMIGAFARGDIDTAINLDPGLRGSATLVVRHYNRVGVLAGVLRVLSEAGLNVEQMENRIFAGGDAAAATIQLTGAIDVGTRAAVAELADVIGVSVEPRRREAG